jgi:DNA polymerase
MANGLPGALDSVCRALSLPIQKQAEGKRLIRQYCSPNFLTQWLNDDKQLMQDYCETDVKTMRLFCSVLRDLTDDEWQQYHITEKMNDRGVPIQVAFAKAALSYSEKVKKDVDRQILTLTRGAVNSARSRKTRDAWLLPLLTTDEKTLLIEDGKISLDKEHQAYLLNSETLNPTARKFIELLQAAGGSAVAKFKSMVDLHQDGRVYGSMVFSGAGATGRFSSRGLQLQNFRSDVFKDPEPLIDAILNGEPVDDPADTLGRLTRSAITSKRGLTYSDYAQIEARVLPWLADTKEAEKTLDIFRQGRDIYSENAVRMFGLKRVDDVTKDLRQSAKVAVLACGFAGGYNALLSMAKIYGMKMSDEQARNNVALWRSANPWAEPLWYGLKTAAENAVRYPNKPFRHGRISFLYDGDSWLWLQLPSGRCLAYFDPKFELVDYPWGDSGVALTFLWGSGKPKAGEKWPRQTVSPITFVQHATQATAADIMRETIVRAVNSGLPVLFSVHDEIIVEGSCEDELTAIMETPPAWAAGLPIAAETITSRRYGK